MRDGQRDKETEKESGGSSPSPGLWRPGRRGGQVGVGERERGAGPSLTEAAVPDLSWRGAGRAARADREP